MGYIRCNLVLQLVEKIIPFYFSFILTMLFFPVPKNSNYVVSFLSSVDHRFPKISLQFENDLALDVYPHDYFLEYEVA